MGVVEVGGMASKKAPKKRLRIYPGVTTSQILTAMVNYVNEKRVVCIWSAFQDCLVSLFLTWALTPN